MSDELEHTAELVVTGDFERVAPLVEQALGAGVDPQEIVERGLRAGMQTVGERFKRNEFFVPEVMMAARAMKTGMEAVRPKLVARADPGLGSVVIGTVQGDLHDIGKNLVAMMLEGAGFEVVDLGTDVAPEAFVEAAREHRAQVVAMSALLTTTMSKMADTIRELNGVELERTVGTLIGGAPVTRAYADEIGADAYAPNAGAAVEVAKELLGAA